MRSDYNDAIVNVVRIRELEVVQPNLTRGEAAFGLPDPLRGSKILPKSVKTETVEGLPVRQHPWVSLPGRAEFVRSCFGVHVIEHLRFENLYSREHQLASWAGGVKR